MSDELKNIELIDKYLNGELDPNELVDFLSKVETDEGLKKELEIHRAMYKGVRKYGDKQLMDELNEIHVQNEKLSKKPYKLYIGVSVFLILSLLVTLPFLSSEKESGEVSESVNEIKDDETLTENSSSDIKSSEPIIPNNDTLSTEQGGVVDNPEKKVKINTLGYYVLETPEIIQYKFNGLVLNLWSKEYIEPKDVSVTKYKGKFILKAKETYYFIQDDNKLNKVKKIQDIRIVDELKFAKKSESKVRVSCRSYNAVNIKRIQAKIDTNENSNNYFLNVGSKVNLILPFRFGKGSHHFVNEKNTGLYYLYSMGEIYELKNTSEFLELRKLEDQQKVKALNQEDVATIPLYIVGVDNIILDEN